MNAVAAIDPDTAPEGAQWRGRHGLYYRWHDGASECSLGAGDPWERTSVRWDLAMFDDSDKFEPVAGAAP